MSFDWPRGSRAGQSLGTDLAPGEFKRLGRPGAYRLGLLRAQGISVRRPPTPFRARFARRRGHRWPAQVWLLGLLASIAVIAAATAVGWSFVPLLAGLGAGFANRVGGWPPRVALPAVAGMAAAGWIVPFLLPHVPGSAGGALARTAGALTGMPGDAVGVAALTAAIAVIQALAGYCLVSAFTRGDWISSP
jgi:hypothetical protein